MQCLRWVFFVLLGGIGPAVAGAGPAPPRALRVNAADAPLGLDAVNVATLRFSWQLDHPDRGETQTAFRILVASSPEELAADRGDCWDSGRVAGGEQHGIVYEGRPFTVKTRYAWKVKWWDRTGAESPWSDPSSFETGILDARTDWTGRYVGGPAPRKAADGTYEANQFNLIRWPFTLPAGKTVKRARAYLAAQHFSLAYFAARLNGRQIGEAALLRNGFFTFDVTDRLVPGVNVIGAAFGDTGTPCGNRKPTEWRSHNLFLCDLEVWFTDGSRLSLGTDAACRGSQGGPVVAADMFGGEACDARRLAEVAGWDSAGFDDAAWIPCAVDQGRERPARGHYQDAVKVHEILEPVAVGNPAPGVFVYDLGRNITGWARLQVRGPAGTVVTLRFAERVNPDGTLNRSSNLSGMAAEATDVYTLSGKGLETWEPALTYHGFRYVEVTGYPGEPDGNAIAGCWAHSDIVREEATFDCSDPLLRKLFEAFRVGERDNSVYVHIDCNQRAERAPWAADAYACAAASLLLFDSANFWQRWINTQNLTTGPGGGRLVGGVGDNVDWGAHTVFIPWEYWLATGDRTYLASCYERSRRFLDNVVERLDPLDADVVHDRDTKEFVSFTDREDWLLDPVTPWNVLEGQQRMNNDIFPHGDWVCTDRRIQQESKPVLANLFYHRLADLVAREAAIVGRTGEAERYSVIAARVRAAVNSTFLAAHGNRGYHPGSQAADAMALATGIVPHAHRPAVLETLVGDIAARGNHLSTGVIGTWFLMPALSEHGRDDVAWALATQTTEPSWGYMLQVPDAPGTFWENWSNSDLSKNHPFLGGSLASWLVHRVAGIRPTAAGWATLECDPCGPAVERLASAEATIPTVKGAVHVAWRRDDAAFRMKLTVPVNASAVVRLPTGGVDPREVVVREGDAVIWDRGERREADRIRVQGAEADRVVLELGSGRYDFVVFRPNE